MPNPALASFPQNHPLPNKCGENIYRWPLTIIKRYLSTNHLIIWRLNSRLGKFSNIFYHFYDSVSISDIVFNKGNNNKMTRLTPCPWNDYRQIKRPTEKNVCGYFSMDVFEWQCWFCDFFCKCLWRLWGLDGGSLSASAGVPAGRNQQCSTHLNHRPPAQRSGGTSPGGRAKLQGSRVHPQPTMFKDLVVRTQLCMPCKRVTIIFSCLSLSLAIYQL